MKLRKTFISPRVLETCEVALELNLLGESREVQFMSSGIETKGHEVVTGGNTVGATWSDGTAQGDYFD